MSVLIKELLTAEPDALVTAVDLHALDDVLTGYLGGYEGRVSQGPGRRVRRMGATAPGLLPGGPVTAAGVRRGGLVTFGEAMGRITADQIGLLDSSQTFTLSVGGAESNVAVAAARLGADVTWAGRLGRDSVGDLIERRLRTEGVRGRITRDDGFTGLMVCSRRTNAGIRVDYHRSGSAGARLTQDDVGEDLIRQAAVLHVTGITPALSDTARATTLWAVRTARAAGATVSVDVNYRSKLWPAQEAVPVLRELVAQADIVFAGPDETALVLGTEDDSVQDQEPLALARALAALGAQEAIVKDGPRGCAAVTTTTSTCEPRSRWRRWTRWAPATRSWRATSSNDSPAATPKRASPPRHAPAPMPSRSRETVRACRSATNSTPSPQWTTSLDDTPPPSSESHHHAPQDGRCRRGMPH
ncbi:hypothetical protein GCM10023191_080720 [Actinoallomurus oryzae]|uniref:Carbohydrate kinase PfkB domain-containing protein n=1 Tax=Actinoallomurus oryzae TaxID=502180 RepID=A0ABP8QYQ9_9ACTN